VLYGLGLFLASLSANKLWVLYATYGVLAGIGLGFAGTRTFLYGFVNDPFLGSSEPAAVRTMASAAGSEFSVPFAVQAVRLSPRRGRVAVSSEDDEEKITFYVGPATGPFVSIEADDVLFIDDARVLSVSERSAETIVRAIALRSPRQPIWERSVPRLYTSHVSLDERHARWRMTGARRDGTVVLMDGAVDGSDVQERHWDAPPGHVGWYSAIASLGGEAFAVESWYTPRMISPRSFSTAAAGWAPLVQPNPMQTRVWVLDAAATHIASSDLDPRCNGQLRDGRPVCMAFDGFRTQVVMVDVQTRRLVPLLWLEGRALAYGAASPGWIAGWWRGEPFALDVDARQVMRAASPPHERTTHIVVSDDALTTIAWSGRRSTVRMYPLNAH
jgi:hypothetical protein